MYTYLKTGLFVLLILNAGFYMAREQASSALDEAAWLVLLFLFEWETSGFRPVRSATVARAIPVIRLMAAATVIVAAIAFAAAGSWLDVANSGLWIGVVVLLETEVRYPHLVARMERGFVTVATVLYAALAGLVVLWAWRGEWLDAYDALLWILAFVIIEMDVLRFSRRASGQSAAASASRASP